MKGSWVWVVLIGCSGEKSGGTTSDRTAVGDADTDTDSDADTDSPPSEDRWVGDCTPSADSPLQRFSFDLQLTTTAGSVTGSAWVSIWGDLGATTLVTGAGGSGLWTLGTTGPPMLLTTAVVQGTWDGSSELDVSVDAGWPSALHLAGAVAGGAWTATLDDAPSGQLAPFACSLALQ